MNFSSPILGASIVVLAITQPALILALEPTQVNEIAKNITVRIEIENGTNTDHGSGVIIARDNSRYYVLSAKHVVKYLDYGYTIVAPDGASYQLDNSTIKYADDVDLAVVAFESDRNYKVALIESSRARIVPGIPIYINGFPAAGQEIQEGAQFTSG